MRTIWSCVFFVLLLRALASAHPLTFTETELVLRVDRTFQVEMICDLDALALGAPQDADDAQLVETLRALSSEEFERRLERLGELFRRRVRVRFDGEPVAFEVAFPTTVRRKPMRQKSRRYWG